MQYHFQAPQYNAFFQSERDSTANTSSTRHTQPFYPSEDNSYLPTYYPQTTPLARNSNETYPAWKPNGENLKSEFSSLISALDESLIGYPIPSSSTHSALQYVPQPSYTPHSIEFGYGGTYPVRQQQLLRNNFLTTAQSEADPDRTPMAPHEIDTPQTTCIESPTSSDGDDFGGDERQVYGEDNERWYSRDIPVANTASWNYSQNGSTNPPPQPFTSSISTAPFYQVERLAPPIVTAPSTAPSPKTPATPPRTVASAATLRPSALPEMHLVPPPTPISPYYRPSTFSTPVSPSSMQFPPPADLNPRFMRQAHLPPPVQPCVSPKNLILPTAQFQHASDPRSSTAQWLAEQGISESSEFDFSLFPSLGEEHSTTPDVAYSNQLLDQLLHPKHSVESPVVEVEEYKPSSDVTDPGLASAVSSLKRSRSLSPDLTYGSLLPIEDDVSDSYAAVSTPPVETTALQPPAAKRARLVSPDRPSRQRVTRSSDISSTTPRKPAIPSLPQPSSSRARKLVPGLQRHFACMHGCESRFSTAYEARRHQEDQHARPEAQGIIDEVATLPEGVAPRIYPREKRFFIQIGLNGGAKWSDRVKREMRDAVDDEDSPMSNELALELVDFSKEWEKAYGEAMQCLEVAFVPSFRLQHAGRRIEPAIGSRQFVRAVHACSWYHNVSSPKRVSYVRIICANTTHTRVNCSLFSRLLIHTPRHIHTHQYRLYPFMLFSIFVALEIPPIHFTVSTFTVFHFILRVVFTSELVPKNKRPS